ncbi:MAG: sigma-70 family RNA polymerase sigma factor [Pseudomonas sp.]|nr:MAG: sigma-70 family RNA polymerase sigma factor [Pseudomonas sp.]
MDRFEIADRTESIRSGSLKHANQITFKLCEPAIIRDLAHDTFIRLMMSRDAQVLGEPRAFLRTLAHGVVVNHWRRQDIERAWLESLAASPAPRAPSPEERLMVLEALCRIDAMLDKLNPKARSAFLMSQLDGLAYAEIATRLAVSERMVKKYMAQAMLQCLMLAQP